MSLKPARRRAIETELDGVEIPQNQVANTDEEISPPDDGVHEKANIVVNPKRSIVIDNDRHPSEFLLKYAEGAPWQVTWYRNLGGMSDLNKFFDFEVENPTQQVECVYNLPILVLSAIDPSQNTDDMSFDVTGEGTLPLSFQVNKNDFFTADIGFNRTGLFYVTESTRLSYDKEGLYRASYKLVSYLQDKHINCLEKATVREFYWEQSKVGLGHTPLLTPKEHVRWVSIAEALTDIKEMYVDNFYDQLTRTLIVPEQDTSVYDPFFVDFVRSLGFSKYPSEISTYNLDPVKHRTIVTLWTAIQKLSARQLKSAVRDMGIYPSASFRRIERMNTVYYSNVKSVLMDPRQKTDGGCGLRLTKDFELEIYSGNSRSVANHPLFRPVTCVPYILSNTFYNGSYSSVLEYAVKCMVERKALDQEISLVLANNVFNLPKIEMFYYMPLVYAILYYSRTLQ